MTDSKTTVSDDTGEKNGEFLTDELVTDAIKLCGIVMDSGIRTEMASGNGFAVQDDGNIGFNTKLISSVWSGCMKNFEEELSKMGFKRTTEMPSGNGLVVQDDRNIVFNFGELSKMGFKRTTE